MAPDQSRLREVVAPGPKDQLALLHDLRSRMAVLEFVFHDGDAGHPLVDALSHLHPERSMDVGVRPGYRRSPAPGSVLHRYVYDRGIITALRDLGGLFTSVSHPRGDRVEWTRLGNVDLSAYDAIRRLFLYTVTHEGLVYVADEP